MSAPARPAPILTALALIVAGCGSGEPPVAKKNPPAELTVFYTCDTRGHLDPCGCSSGMAGGIGRRSYFLNQHKPQSYLLVDAGDVGAGPRDFEQYELGYLLAGYDHMGYHAVNAGHREAQISLPDLIRLKAKYPRFVSANLLDDGGQPVFAPYRLVELDGGACAGIIGVMDDRLDAAQLGAGLRVAAPEDAIRKYLPELRRQAQLIVLLAFADEERMKRLAEEFFEIELICGGKVPQSKAEPLRHNQALITYITDKGKHIGALKLARADGRWRVVSNTITELGDQIPYDPWVEELLEQYKAALAGQNFRPLKDDVDNLTSVAYDPNMPRNRYTGSQACRECHAPSFEKWETSKHAAAFHALAEKGHQFNPRCLACHTTGYMSPDGYLNPRQTAQLQGVGCEFCHGRGEWHVRFHRRELRLEAAAARMIRKIDCVICHDADNSRHYQAESYWKKIEHYEPNLKLSSAEAPL